MNTATMLKVNPKGANFFLFQIPSFLSGELGKEKIAGGLLSYLSFDLADCFFLTETAYYLTDFLT